MTCAPLVYGSFERKCHPMRDEGSHIASVDAWLAAHDSAPDLLPSFELALMALWMRTKTTLGEITLTAIVERVLHIASETFPFVAAIKVEPGIGIVCGGLAERIGSAPPVEVRQAVRFVLVELLTVLGNLTAEILTPELHAELSRLATPEAVRLEAGSHAPEPTQHVAVRTRAHDEET